MRVQLLRDPLAERQSVRTAAGAEPGELFCCARYASVDGSSPSEGFAVTGSSPVRHGREIRRRS